MRMSVAESFGPEIRQCGIVAHAPVSFVRVDQPAARHRSLDIVTHEVLPRRPRRFEERDAVGRPRGSRVVRRGGAA